MDNVWKVQKRAAAGLLVLLGWGSGLSFAQPGKIDPARPASAAAIPPQATKKSLPRHPNTVSASAPKASAPEGAGTSAGSRGSGGSDGLAGTGAAAGSGGSADMRGEPTRR